MGGTVGKAIGNVLPKRINSPILRKGAGILGAAGLESLGNKYSNELQMRLANKYSGQEYGTWDNPTASEIDAGVLGMIGGLLPAAHGAYKNITAPEPTLGSSEFAELYPEANEIYQRGRIKNSLSATGTPQTTTTNRIAQDIENMLGGMNWRQRMIEAQIAQDVKDRQSRAAQANIPSQNVSTATENENFPTNSTSKPSPQSQTQQPKQQGNIYLGENGKGDSVSLKGAQPQTLNAIDALAKWYHDKTGKQLVVTSVVDGSSHVSGEHSHGTGWKFDINDNDNGALGTITIQGKRGTQYPKGTLADELIKYGQSLGLGMNWEGNHIDVQVDGYQWEGEHKGKNFGGFNPSKAQAQTKGKKISRANDPNFSEKENNLWRYAQKMSD